MDKKAFSRTAIVLGVILLCSLGLRLYKLNYQSLWCDELHTMREADPDLSWKQCFRLITSAEKMPPLYFILSRLMFQVFGYTPYVARLLSVIIGTLGIAALYFLGKEFLNRQLGVLSALLGAVNFFHLYYSQEARGYTLAFLLTILSFLFLVKSIKNLKSKDLILYGTFSLLLLYTHYFGFFVLASQVVIIVIFILLERHDRLRYLIRFAVCLLAVFVGYIPWMPFLGGLAQVKSIWIRPPLPDFMTKYFLDFFGQSDLIKPFLLLLLLYYAFRVFADKNAGTESIKTNPLQMSFLVMTAWVFLTHLIPYLRSLTVLPMLHPRYLIIALPAYLIALSYGALLINNRVLRALIVSILIILSSIDLIFVRKYYTKVTKTQHREAAEYVVKNNGKNYPIIIEKAAWQQQYYFKRLGVAPKVLSGKKDKMVDLILAKIGTKEETRGFWIMGLMGDQKPPRRKADISDMPYYLAREKDYYNAWAQLYLSLLDRDEKSTVISYRSGFLNGTILDAARCLAIFSGSVEAKPVHLLPGRYRMSINVRGTSAAGEDARLGVYIDRQIMKSFYVNSEFQYKTLDFVVKNASDIHIQLFLENDYVDSVSKEDRNLFVRHMLIKRTESK
jgi:uncharacterized membrane protein